MATRAHSATGAFASPVKITSISAGLPSSTAAPFLRLLSRFSRHELEGFISAAIDLLDLADGDVDFEDDDPTGGNVEEDGECIMYVTEAPRYRLDQSLGPISNALGLQVLA